MKARFPNANLHTEQLDVTDDNSVDDFIKRISEKYDKIDALINNAGVAKKGDSWGPDVVEFTFATVTISLL